ncbi:hypothetical protein LTR37_015380 [Vermiconidia calcicola]|uniref:Uncharacterized protein n=1 Tax=Vermiconidia calcicola TaxID=1690605 RepID=A0ACC3MTN2_9PEZI|nr:hypothetical protein LTR37_015380 [Vermiconidia calcicola]
MANSLLSFVGWYFLPNLVTGYLQSILYTIFIRAGDPKPAPGSPRHTRDRKRIHIFVILVYLLYTVYDADYQLRLAGDFYQALGVPHDVDDKALQSRFRRLTVQYHPDKATGPDKAEVEAIYVQLKLARDTLIDPAKRFAYDRFGEDILQWRHSKTIRDFVFHGVQRTAGYYVASGGVLVLLGVLGYLNSGRFWRYMVMAGLFTIELYCMTRPTLPAVLTNVVNPFLTTTGLRQPYLPFQVLALLRKLSITIFIALAQLGPLLEDQKAGSEGDAVTPQQLDRLDAIAKTSDQEVTRLMGLELSPFVGEPAGMRGLRSSLKEWLVQNTIRNDPEVKRAISVVLSRRRQDGGTAAE